MSTVPDIRIGNQTAFSASPIELPFYYALDNGFDAFEWFPDKKPSGDGWDEANLDKGVRFRLRDLAAGRGVRMSVHARWQANPLDPQSWPLLLKDLDLAADLGAVLVNIHLYTEAGMDAYVRAITPLLKLTAAMGLQLSIENTPFTSPEDFNELFGALQKLGSVPFQHAGMCLDIGHANLYGWTRHNYLKYIDQLAPDVPIIHLHLHENFGDHDSHLPLFTGPAANDSSGVAAFLDRLRHRNYSGSAILEQWPHPVWLLNQARDRLRAMIG